MKIYTKVMLVVIALASIYGFLVPTLVSMRDSIAVVSGLLIAIFFGPAIGFYFGKKYINSVINKEEEK